MTATELFDWAELTFPALFPTGVTRPSNQTYLNYSFRHYASMDHLLAVNLSDGTVLGITQLSRPTPSFVQLGQLPDYLCRVFPTRCATVTLAQKAGLLAQTLGKPRRLLLGLGDTSSSVAVIRAQGLRPDIYERYLVGAGSSGWPSWNSPSGAYVGVVAANADAVGATPMFTLYQMATLGDGNISGLSDANFMRGYWDNVRLMFTQLRAYNKPVLVNFEPDFWGYTNQVTAEPTQHFAHVNSQNSDCATLPNSVTGMAQCLLAMARTQAPKALVGFPPSLWGNNVAAEVSYMHKLVAPPQADFVVMQTLDRDAGCFEARYIGDGALCTRPSALPYYWDASNLTEPSFTTHLATARQFHEGLQLPLVWWQTPMGVPSTTPGGSALAFRDNRTQYFLTRPNELVAAGGVAVVFSPGHPSQTNVTTDGGQYQRLSTQYLASPAALP